MSSSTGNDVADPPAKKQRTTEGACGTGMSNWMVRRTQETATDATTTATAPTVAISRIGSTWLVARSFGNRSEYYGVVYGPDLVDRLMAAILLEMQPLWLARNHPSVAFTIYGKTLGVTRDKAILGEVIGPLEPRYGYGSPEQATVHPFTPTLALIRDHIDQGIGIRCNHVVVNRYNDQNDQIGYHTDKDKDFADDYSIVTVSFGATRVIHLRERERKSGKPCAVLELPSGSVYRLNQATNKAFKHSVPRVKDVRGMRLGLTFRTVKTMYNSETKQIIK